MAGTFTLNSDMDYRALISGMSANSATRATVKVTIPEGLLHRPDLRPVEGKERGVGHGQAGG